MSKYEVYWTQPGFKNLHWMRPLDVWMSYPCNIKWCRWHLPFMTLPWAPDTRWTNPEICFTLVQCNIHHVRADYCDCKSLFIPHIVAWHLFPYDQGQIIKISTPMKWHAWKKKTFLLRCNDVVSLIYRSRMNWGLNFSSNGWMNLISVPWKPHHPSGVIQL